MCNCRLCTRRGKFMSKGPLALEFSGRMKIYSNNRIAKIFKTGQGPEGTTSPSIVCSVANLDRHFLTESTLLEWDHPKYHSQELNTQDQMKSCNINVHCTTVCNASL